MLTCTFKQELVLLFDSHRNLCLQLVVEQRADTAMCSYAAARKPALSICLVMGSAEPCELYPLRWSDLADGPLVLVVCIRQKAQCIGPASGC